MLIFPKNNCNLSNTKLFFTFVVIHHNTTFAKYWHENLVFLPIEGSVKQMVDFWITVRAIFT